MTTLRPISRVARRLRRGATLAFTGALLALAVASASSQVARIAASSPAPVARAEAGVRWRELSPQQRDALAPLEREWAAIDASRKQKWVTLAGRFPSLGTD